MRGYLSGRRKFLALSVTLVGTLVPSSFVVGQERKVPPQPEPAVLHDTQLAEPIGLAALEQMALQCNPTLVQAGAKLEAARGRTLQAGLYPNPTVGYTSEEIGQRGTAGQQGLFVDQVIVTGRKLQLNRAKFSQEITQAEWQALAQQYRVLNGVRMQFYAVLLRERLRDVRADLMKIADDGVRTTEELVNVGQANRPDLLQARIEARRQRVALESARYRLEASWRELAAIIGNRQLTVTPLDGDLEAASPPLDWDATLAHLLEASPEVQIARAETMRSQFGLHRERIEPIPNLNLRAGTTYSFESRNQLAMLEVGVRLPVWNRNQGNICAAQAELGRALAEVPRVELRLQERLARTFARYRTAVVVVEGYRGRTLEDGSHEPGTLDDAEETYLQYRDALAKRRAAYPQVLIAQRDYFQSRVEYVEALAELRRLEVAIRGLLLVDGLEEPPGPANEGERPRNTREGMEQNLPDPINGRKGRGLED